jgi:hypothetical protein
MSLPTWARGTLLLVVTLAAGVGIGMTYERHRAPSHAALETDAHHVMHHFERELGLDSAQQRAIAAIFARHQGAVDSSWHVLQPHVRATLDSTLQEIATVLRPGQLAKYRTLIESRHPGMRH